MKLSVGGRYPLQPVNLLGPCELRNESVAAGLLVRDGIHAASYLELCCFFIICSYMESDLVIREKNMLECLSVII